MSVVWNFTCFDSLKIPELYAILQLRSAVFIIGQQCAYQDLDDRDQAAIHVTGRVGGRVVSYCRLLPPEISGRPAGIGRVLTTPELRRQGLARQMMRMAIAYISLRWDRVEIHISAQYYLQEFYRSLGFLPLGAIYEEEGIPHIKMMWQP